MPSLTEKYASLTADAEVTEREADDMAAFVADVTEAKLAGDDEALSRSLFCYLSTFPEKVQLKLARLIEEMDEGGEQEKAAGLLDMIRGMGPVGKGLLAGGVAVGVPALLGGALSLAGKAVDDLMARQGSKALSTVIQQFPALKADMPQTVANYATIQRFAPSMASDPNAVGGLLNNLNQLGPGAMTYQTLSQLAKLESDHVRAIKDRPGYFSSFAEGASKGIGSASGDIAKSIMQMK